MNMSATAKKILTRQLCKNTRILPLASREYPIIYLGREEEMKHGKRHRAEIARSLPQWERKFLCYKALKKKLKLRQDMGFRHSLGRELDKVNDFFIDKEEDYIILFRELESKAENINGHEEILELLKEILAFHSEMVMLLHYSVINFAGLMKIVKKHKKRAGGRVCASYMPRVLQQPFFSTELLYNLIRGCEAILERLSPPQ